MEDSPPNDRSRCVVLVPYAGRIEPACEHALRSLEHRGYAVRRAPGFTSIDVARSQLATDVLAQGFEELMWIDADIGFDPDHVERLRSYQLPLACGVYVKKGARALACDLVPGTEELTFGKQGGRLEVRYAATGFFHTRKMVYERMQAQLGLPTCNEQFGRPLVPYFLPMIVDVESRPWYLAEDFAFCERARCCGFAIWADTTIRLWHYGTYAYSWEDAGEDRERYSTYRYRLH